MINVEVAAIRQKVEGAIAAAGTPARLIGFEAVEIQRFVTASSRPIAMNGASESIKRFDKFIDGREETIFAGGGRGVLVVPERIATERVKDLKREFRRSTYGSPLAVVEVPFDPARQEESLHWLWLKQSGSRDACDPEQFELDFSKGTCADCRARPAFRRSEKPDSADEQVCERCYAMVRLGREIQSGEARERWTLEDLSNDGRVAVVCADGNRLGQFFRSLHNLVALRAGSQVIWALFLKAHEEARKHAGNPRHVALVSGGDDLKAFLPSAPALEYVTGLINAIERHTHGIQGLDPTLRASSVDLLRGLGLGIGLFVAPYHIPASRLVEHALDLEKEAKRLCLAHKDARSAVDFSLLSSDGEMGKPQRGPSDDKLAEPTQRDKGRGGRIVRGDQWAEVVRHARALIKVPASQRAAASDAWRLDEAEFYNRFYYQLARSETWQGWFRECGVDWRDRAAVRENIPDRATLSLARLIEDNREDRSSKRADGRP